jgi:hypothetical protein
LGGLLHHPSLFFSHTKNNSKVLPDFAFQFSLQYPKFIPSLKLNDLTPKNYLSLKLFFSSNFGLNLRDTVGSFINSFFKCDLNFELGYMKDKTPYFLTLSDFTDHKSGQFFSSRIHFAA